MIGNVGPMEIAIVLIIALVVFGPKRLPELGSGLGRGMREFKESITGEKKDEDDVKAIGSAGTNTISPPQSSEPQVVRDNRG